MYERFTDRARKTLQLANQEAQRFNHEYIGTEHLLLGLVKEGAGVAANVLKNLDVDARKIRSEIEKIVQPGSAKVSPGRLPQTPRAKRVIEFAIEESRILKHVYVGTEHLLLGLLREGVAAQVLMNLGLRLADVRDEVLNILGEHHGSLPVPVWEYDVYIPLTRKDGAAVESHDIEQFMRRVQEQFSDSQIFAALKEGTWKVGNQGSPQGVILLRFVIEKEAMPRRAFFLQWKKELQEQFGDGRVMIVQKEAEVL